MSDEVQVVAELDLKRSRLGDLTTVIRKNLPTESTGAALLEEQFSKRLIQQRRAI
jgi:hypothetical protein